MCKIFHRVLHTNDLNLLRWIYSHCSKGKLEILNSHVRNAYFSEKNEFFEVTQWLLTFIEELGEEDVVFFETACQLNDLITVKELLQKDVNGILTREIKERIIHRVMDLNLESMLNLLLIIL